MNQSSLIFEKQVWNVPGGVGVLLGLALVGLAAFSASHAAAGDGIEGFLFIVCLAAAALAATGFVIVQPMVVLCSERPSQPVISAGTIY